MNDYFEASPGFSSAIQSLERVPDGDLSPHWPVQITLFPQNGELRAMTLARPQRVPSVRLIGPCGPPPDYQPVKDMLQDALLAAQAGEGKESQAPLAIAELAGVELRAPGARGSVPDIVWQPVYLRDVKPPSLARAGLCQ
eukprot:3694805-Pyramimonas_sp.AAC.1